MSAFMDAAETLAVNGHGILANACYDFYAKQCQLKGHEECDRILAMNDEILLKELGTSDPISSADIVMGGDFVYLKALARTLQELGLSPFEVLIELTDEDLIDSKEWVVGWPYPPPAPAF